MKCGVTALGIILSVSAGAQAQQAWPDPLLNAPVTPETTEKGLAVDAYVQGVQAWVWGYPLVRMERVMRDYTTVPDPLPDTSYRAPLNRIGWARRLADAQAFDMPTANNDTLYMSAVVDLTEPYLLTVPDLDDRYYVINTFNMWQELEHYIGRRTTGTKAGTFALVPPGWEGTLPDGVTVLQISTSKVWLWGRLHVRPSDDYESLHAIQDAFDLRPLSALGQADWTAPEASLPPLPDIGDDPLGFLQHVGAALQYNEVKPQDAALFAQLSRIGLTQDGFDPQRLSPSQAKELARALADAPNVAVAAIADSGEVKNGWSYISGLDAFGTNYPLRAMVSGPYLGGNGDLEAVYPARFTDDAGALLTGEKIYHVGFASAPPSGAFWSLTIYNAEDKMLSDNTIDRYKLGSEDDLTVAADGSFELTLSHRAPESTENWLPVPEGPFYMVLRIYQPQPAFFDGTWKMPSVTIQ